MPEEQTPTSESITDDLRELGSNLVNALQSTWESVERKELQRSVEKGLSGVLAALEDTADDLDLEDVSQRVRASFSQIEEKIRSGELEDSVRTNVTGILERIHTELVQFSAKMAPSDPETGEAHAPTPGSESPEDPAN